MQYFRVLFPSRPVKNANYRIKYAFFRSDSLNVKLCWTDLPFSCSREDLPLWEEEEAVSLWVWGEEEVWAPLPPPSQRGSVPAAQRGWSSLWDPAASCTTSQAKIRISNPRYSRTIHVLQFFTDFLYNSQSTASNDKPGILLFDSQHQNTSVLSENNFCSSKTKFWKYTYVPSSDGLFLSCSSSSL